MLFFLIARYPEQIMNREPAGCLLAHNKNLEKDNTTTHLDTTTSLLNIEQNHGEKGEVWVIHSGIFMTARNKNCLNATLQMSY